MWVLEDGGPWAEPWGRGRNGRKVCGVRGRPLSCFFGPVAPEKEAPCQHELSARRGLGHLTAKSCASQRQELGGVQIAPHTDAPHPPGSTLQPTLETTPIPFRRRAGGKAVADSCSGTLLGEENKPSYSPM